MNVEIRKNAKQQYIAYVQFYAERHANHQHRIGYIVGDNITEATLCATEEAALELARSFKDAHQFSLVNKHKV